jgi:hypothetical protein
MKTHLQNNSYKKLTRQDLTTGFSACEADTVSLSYTPCYVRMARHCHEASYVVADPFTNMIVFFYVRFHESGQPISQSHTERTS